MQTPRAFSTRVVLVPRPDDEERVGWRPHPVVAALGWASMAVLLVTCVATAVYLFVAPRGL